VQIEPWLPRDKAMIDILKSVGIDKGKAFSPDAKAQDALKAAAREAHDWFDARYETSDFGRKRWGDEGYAMEELVAELGAAFLSADLDLTPEIRDDHAAYIPTWIRVLKNDKRAIFTAAAHAQRAANFLISLQAKVEATEVA